MGFFPRGEGRTLELATGCDMGFLNVFAIEEPLRAKGTPRDCPQLLTTVRQVVSIANAHGKSNAVHALAAGVNIADGLQYLVSGGGDGSTRLWSVPPPKKRGKKGSIGSSSMSVSTSEPEGTVGETKGEDVELVVIGEETSNKDSTIIFA